MFLATALDRRPMSGPVDAEADLVARLARGDLAAIEAMYGRFARPLFAYARALVADDGTAEEVVQDTFLAAWRGAATFQGRSTLSSWLFGIARRQARDRMRRSAPILEPVELLAETPDPEVGPEAAALAGASREVLQAAMRRLPAADREVLLLTFAYDLAGPEVAEVLGIPAGTVKSRLFSARRRLREQLSEEDAI